MQFSMRNCNVRILKEMKIAESLVFLLVSQRNVVLLLEAF